MRIKSTLLLSCVLIAAPGLAAAQAPPSPAAPPAQTAPPAPSRQANCAPMQPHSGTPAPQGRAPEGQTTGQSREPLGDKLARSEGVLCPPEGIDPEIRAPTPEGGNTPV